MIEYSPETCNKKVDIIWVGEIREACSYQKLKKKMREKKEEENNKRCNIVTIGDRLMTVT